MSEQKFKQNIKPRVLMIDNYDSFTWNVYQFLNDAGGEVVVYRNDKITVEQCFALEPTHVVISPGPGCPKETGVSMDVIRAFAGKLPIFGVCMGQQCMYEVYGGVVEFAGEIVHGKTSKLIHDGKSCFKDIPNEIQVTRYHSLAGRASEVPEVLEVNCRTENGIVMGVRHKHYCMEGVQFHPESVLSEFGLEMFKNFLAFKSGLWENENLLSKLPPHNENDLKSCIKLLDQKQEVPENLMCAAIAQIISGFANDSQVSAFLLSLKYKGETANDVHSIVSTILKVAAPCDVVDAVDIVGTGGDGHNTFNVSTTAGIVAASVGIKVAKHGNRSSSSKCGSADILEKLGAKLNLPPQKAADIVNSEGYCFLFAPAFHPALRHVAKVRKSIGVRTVFNIIGPLVNPTKLKAAVVGVYSQSVGLLMAETLRLGGLKRGLVVCGKEELDEVSISGPTHVWEIIEGVQDIKYYVISPSDFGVPCHPLSIVSGGEPEDNAQILLDLFDGKPGPCADFVIINAAALLVVAGKAKDWKEGAEMARDALNSGKAKILFNNYIKATNN